MTILAIDTVSSERGRKNGQFVDFTFDPCRVGFRAGLVIAAHGDFYMSKTGLSGPGQEEN